MTLLAMVLAVGLVVDDTIIVLENISRRIENGMPTLDATLKGSGKISAAIVAKTIPSTEAPEFFHHKIRCDQHILDSVLRKAKNLKKVCK